ncbi:hypothetical protein ACHAWX_001337 [Stephanocyclus meneghinianus]
MIALSILVITTSILRSFSFSYGVRNTRLVKFVSRPMFSRFFVRPGHGERSNASIKALHLSSEDEVQALLEKAKKLREEAAAMSGKTLEEIEEESKREKRQMEERKHDLIEISRNKSQAGAGAASRIVPVPEDARLQVQQAASAVERAFKDGIVRQTIRFALITDDEEMSGELNEWPGGAKQMFREAGRPLTEALLREVNVDSSGQSNLPPTITTKDIWDFDGSAIISSKTGSQDRGGDVTALVFPNTDSKYLRDIETIDGDVGPDRLFLLINPFWRNVESWGFNILQPNGKKRAQEVVFDNGYDITYAVLRFSARGEDCIALKAYPYDWQMYAYREDPSWFNRRIPIWLGSSTEEPTSSQFTELLNSRPEFKMSKNMRQMQRMMGNDDQ